MLYEITFIVVGAKLSHNDALIITMMMANYQIHLILVDNGALLKLIKTPFMDFGGESVTVEGAIQLPVIIGEALDQVISIIDFLVLNCPSMYNMILVKLFLNSIKEVTSTYSLIIKFLVGSSVGIVTGEQQTARKSCALAMKSISLKVGYLLTTQESKRIGSFALKEEFMKK